MAEALKRVGVREFREELAEYLDSKVPVAITRHGRTVGYFVPTRADQDEETLDHLERAVTRMEALLAAHGVTEDEVVRAFRDRNARG